MAAGVWNVPLPAAAAAMSGRVDVIAVDCKSIHSQMSYARLAVYCQSGLSLPAASTRISLPPND